MNELTDAFNARFGINDNDKISFVKSPLRICPIGAHVDHQNGFVTGMTLDASIDMAFICDDNGDVIVQSLDFSDEDCFHIDDVPEKLPEYWGNYLRGATLALKRKYKLKKGIKAVISGKQPVGGLSSSAAVITAYLMALCSVNEISISKMETIEHSHWAESEYVGLNNGILDQAANILSIDNHLLYMDCETNEYELIEKPSGMKEFEIVVVYSGISKMLVSTDYNNRVDECNVATWLLQELSEGIKRPLKDAKLRDVDEEIYQKYKDVLPRRFAKRAEHFFSENERVRKGSEAWRKGDIAAFGRLMFESGESSINNYECGCPELISIYEILKKCPGMYGARFSGAGYRGCCIGIIDPRYKDDIRNMVDKLYPIKHPEYKDSYKVYFSKTDGGARIIEAGSR